MTVFFRKNRRNPNKNAQNLPRTTRLSSWAASWQTPCGRKSPIPTPFGEEPEWIHFALTRQFPDGEGGLVEILLDIGFPDVKGRLQLEDELCSDELDERENVFDYIRRSVAYTALADTPPTAVDITCECT